ncbi:vomeronasal type-2 receptor 26-like [Pleurodeles waltl]|uniref:vomeronasal type-2 receptor 26-like n=1 Tax=Pleurodeles waltl TaxID=8319 RepID=UPI003709BFFD
MSRAEAALLRGQRLQTQEIRRISGALRHMERNQSSSMQLVHSELQQMNTLWGDLALSMRQLVAGLMTETEGARRRDRQLLNRLDRMSASILNKYMKTVRFNSTGGDDMYFDETGSLSGHFDILNLVVSSETTVSYNKVGHSFSANGIQDIFLEESNISWSSNFTQRDSSSLTRIIEDREALDYSITTEEIKAALKALATGKAVSTDKIPLEFYKVFFPSLRAILLAFEYRWFKILEKLTPISICNPSCFPGFRKIPEPEKQVCCYSCSPCGEGEISNQTDMENCLMCPRDQWPNEKKDTCIPRTLEILSYEDPLGVTLASTSVLFSVVGVVVLANFIKHHHTALVKANNRDLSYILLISLILSFLCCLIFIGRPVKLTCLLRQTSFSIIFTIAVSSVLAKTVTVVLAFNATKPGSQLRKWVGPRLGNSLVIFLSLGEGIICIVWIILAPPFPDVDTSEMGKMILQCNDGSAVALYLVIGYIGVLALLSFLLAFFARRLPDSFNEAQLITFSMMVFCSVWVAFIPAYLSTKGKYMVAVEIFAILASTAGLLGCIFIPKCYIILLRPDRNTKEFLVGKK